MTDYSDANVYAISSIGYGKGFTAEEAEANYYTAQVRNLRHVATTDEARREWVEHNAAPTLWRAPEGVDGFQIGVGSWWTKDGKNVREFEEADRVILGCSSCGSTAQHHLDYVRTSGNCVL